MDPGLLFGVALDAYSSYHSALSSSFKILASPMMVIMVVANISTYILKYTSSWYFKTFMPYGLVHIATTLGSHIFSFSSSLLTYHQEVKQLFISPSLKAVGNAMMCLDRFFSLCLCLGLYMLGSRAFFADATPDPAPAPPASGVAGFTPSKHAVPRYGRKGPYVLTRILGALSRKSNVYAYSIAIYGTTLLVPIITLFVLDTRSDEMISLFRGVFDTISGFLTLASCLVSTWSGFYSSPYANYWSYIKALFQDAKTTVQDLIPVLSLVFQTVGLGLAILSFARQYSLNMNQTGTK